MLPLREKFVLGRGRNVIVCGLCVILLLSSCATLRSFRRAPRGERLERIKTSPNWEDGRFRNAGGEVDPDEPGIVPYSISLLTAGGKTRPRVAVPAIKTNLRALDRNRDCFVWFGHASIFFQTGGLRCLMDPVLTNVWPQRMLLRPFKGTTLYTPDDIPDLDVLIITHNHWDHLDYFTVTRLFDRVSKVICPLGVGEYLEYWGCPKEKLVEMDWGDVCELPGGALVRALTAVHNSRRFSAKDRTLWASFVLRTPSRSIFISGDGGYGPHFAQIARDYGPFDLAVLENGQYGKHAGTVHTRPEELRREIEDLSPKAVFTYHNSKYALARHPWQEPLELIYEYEGGVHGSLLTPIIGEVVYLDGDLPAPRQWWKLSDKN